MTQNNIYQLVKRLAEREEIEQKEVVKILTLSLQKFYQEKEQGEVKLQSVFDEGQKKILFYRYYQIVEEVKNPTKEITEKSEIFLKSKGKREGDQFLVPTELEGIDDNKLILREIHRLLGKIKRRKWANEFRPLEGKIIEGDIKVAERNFCLVSLNEEVLAFLGRDEWLPRERLEEKQHLKFLLKKVEEDQILLSRKDDLFLRKLLEDEIPEISEGIIVIKDILRLPGIISKIIVESKKVHLNPSGTCIGRGGVRIKEVNKNLGKERIDIVDWKEDLNGLIINLLSPVKVISLISQADCFLVIVPQNQMSLALVEKGQLVKLVSDYLGKKITIRTLEEAQNENTVIRWNGSLTFEEYQKLREKYD